MNQADALRAAIAAQQKSRQAAPPPQPKGESFPWWGWIVLVLFAISVLSGNGPSMTACDMSLTEPLHR